VKKEMPNKLKLRQLHVKLGLVSINTVPLDFKRNYKHIMQSIQECIDLGCTIRIGSELEISGYGCGDHFAEYDTIYHSWDIIKDILKSGITEQIVCELGTPVLHKAALYNARVILYQTKVVAIRVKTIAADGDMYNETRFFSTWKYKR
jgi:NAD+ synthase (glutamine-hydrolysing)